MRLSKAVILMRALTRSLVHAFACLLVCAFACLRTGRPGRRTPIHTQKDKHKRSISNVRVHSFDSIIMDGRTDMMDNF